VVCTEESRESEGPRLRIEGPSGFHLSFMIRKREAYLVSPSFQQAKGPYFRTSDYHHLYLHNDLEQGLKQAYINQEEPLSIYID
jgi:hypothetical protein